MDQAVEYCKRTGQTDKLEKLAKREGPKQEQPQFKEIYVKELPKNKFGNIPTEVNGIVFQSKKEAKYYIELLMLQRCGVVKTIDLQPVYLLQEAFTKNGKKFQKIEYIADFESEYTDGHVEIVDTKGVKTKEFRIKQKLFEYKYPDKTLIIV